MSRLPWFYNHIVLHLQMLYQVVLGNVGDIAPMNQTSKLCPILFPMNALYGNWGKGNHIWNQNTKKKKLNVGINILDEGYPLYDEGIAQKDKRSKKNEGIA